MHTAGASTDRTSVLAAMGWAAYLACSWTWCIGMYLPVLLVRDFGVWGFVVFAVPNVLGAAAMGWVIRSRRQSLKIVRAHRPAAALFSAVTIAFQVFFLVAIAHAPDLRGFEGAKAFGSSVSLYACVAVLFLLYAFAGRWWSAGAWCASVLLLGAAAWWGGLWVPTSGPWPGADDHGERTVARDLLLLAPVCTFGFALCPYLDMTFHRARQALEGRAARFAFGVGFGVLFLVMILGTLGFSTALLFASLDPQLMTTAWARHALNAHLVLQLLFTCLVHVTELLRLPSRPRRMALAVFVTLGVASAITLAFDRGLSVGGQSGFEVAYRCFMGFYGLVFPAYVWLCVIPGRAGAEAATPTRQSLAVFAAAVLLAAPCFWMGFIERHELWLVPGLGIVLLARLAVRGGAETGSVH